MEFFEDDRNEVACQRSGEHVQNHRHAGNKTEPGVEIVEQGDDGNQSSDHEAIDQTGHNLFTKDSKAIFLFNLIQRQGTDDNGEGLGPGVAAHAGYDRHDGGKSNNLGDGSVELCDDAGGQDRGGKIDDKPGKSGADRVLHGAVDLLLLVDSAHPVDILGCLLVDDIDDVIDGDDTDHPSVLIDNRQRSISVFGEEPGHGLLIQIGPDRNHVVVHDV